MQEAVSHDLAENAETPWIDIEGLAASVTERRSEPFPLFVAPYQLPDFLGPLLAADFPRGRQAGYLPYEPDMCGDSLNHLVSIMTSPAFSDAVGELLGIERLSQYPTLVSISTSLNKRHGNIHTDGKAKVASVLMYLNREWPHGSAGCLRFLNRIDDIEDMVLEDEILPVFGTLIGFQRTENSFHGHLPFEGERRVVQVAWVVSEEEKQRKRRVGRLSRLMKRITRGFDKRIGAGRS